MTPRYYQPVEYTVLWSGRKTDPSLLSDYPRQSTLAVLCQVKRQSKAKKHRVSRNVIRRPA